MKSGVIACVAALAGLPAAGVAQIGTDFTFQGRLDSGGSAYNGIANLRVTLFDGFAGGSPTCTQLFNGVTVNDGVFTLLITDCDAEALGNAITFAEVQVNTGGGFTTLAPRLPLTAAPYSAATRGLNVDNFGAVEIPVLLNVTDGTGGVLLNSGGGIFMQAANPNGDVTVNLQTAQDGGSILIMRNGDGVLTSAMGRGFSGTGGFYESATPTGSLAVRLYSDGDIFGATSGSGDGFMELQSNSDTGFGGQIWLNNRNSISTPGIDLRGGGGAFGGQLLLNDVSGNSRLNMNVQSNGAEIRGFSGVDGQVFYLDNDATTGGGGFLSIARSETGTSGFTVNGNAGGENTAVSISGTSATVNFNPGQTIDDFRVVLPPSSITAGEIGDEPGVVNVDTVGVGLTTSPAIIESATINAPAGGFVLAIASAEIFIQKAASASGTVTFGITNNGTSLPAQQDFEVTVPVNLPSGNYDSTNTVHAVLPVSAGANTFNFVGFFTGSGVSSAIMQDTQFSLIYFPTAYGTVSPSVMGRGVDDATVVYAGLTQAEVEASRIASIEADNARIRAELEQYRLQHEMLMQELEAIRREQNAGGDRVVRSTPQKAGSAAGN